MKNSIWQEFYLCRKRLWFLTMVAAGSWLTGVLGMLIFQQVVKNEKTIFPIGTTMLLGIGGFLLFFLLANAIPQNFNLAISMGKTRKSYLPALILWQFLIVFSVYFLGALGFLAEKGLYQRFYPGRELTGNLGPFLTPAWILCYSILETGLLCLYGGALKKKPKVANIIFLVIWISLCWCSGGFWGYEEADGSVLGGFNFWGYQFRLWFTGFSVGLRMSGMLLTGLAGMALMYVMLRREAAD